MAKKKTSKRTKTTKKTGEALRQEALKEAEANVARLEAEERAPAPGTSTPTAAPAAKSAKAKTGKARSAKNAPKAATGRKGAKQPKAKKLSGLDAAASVLTAFKEPMNCKDIAERAIAAGWKTDGKTPAATLHAAISREIAQKGRQARFKKAGRGMFAANK